MASLGELNEEYVQLTSPLHNVLLDIDPDDNILNNLYPDNNHSKISSYYTVQRFNDTYKNLNFFSILHTNIRSINANSDQFVSLLNSLCVHLDCFILTETWLTDNSVNTANFNGYKAYHVIRQDKRGGGVSVFVSNKYNSRSLDSICRCTSTIEVCAVSITDDVILLCIYRPHSDTIDNFVVELVDILNELSLRNKDIVILGDFNVNLFDSDSMLVNLFVSEMQSHGFYNVISKPTRIPPNESNVLPSLLDHIWTNILRYNSSGIIASDTSDHLPTFIHLPVIKDLPDKIKVTFRNHSHDNIALFRSKLQLVDWSDVLVGDTEQQTTKFSNTLSELYCKTFPVCSKFLSTKRVKKPWITSGIIKSIKTKSYYFKLLKLGSISNRQYVTFKNKLTSIIRKSKINYHNRAFNSNRSNVKKTWSLIKNLLGTTPRESIRGILCDDELVTDGVHMANIFNKYFSSVATDLNANIPVSKNCPMSYLKNNMLSSVF